MTETIDGIKVHRHWTYITPNKGFLKKTLGHLSYLPSAIWHSFPRIARPDIAIGTSPTFFAAMAAARLATKKEIPFVMEVRDLWPGIFVDLGVIRNKALIMGLEKMELALYRRADSIVTVTTAFRGDLLDRGVPPEKIATVHNGADLDFWEPTGADPDMQSKLGIIGKFVVLYIGAHGISQALNSLLESARQLKDYPLIRFIFVGEGAEKQQLIKEATAQHLTNVQFLDPVDKESVKRFYSLAHVCLVPLRNIPLFKTFIPSKMFEMLAMGKPIVASVRGEAAEILRESRGAIVVEPENSEAIAKAILSLYENRDQVQKMGESGRSFVAQNFSRRALADKYLGILENAIAGFRAKTND